MILELIQKIFSTLSKIRSDEKLQENSDYEYQYRVKTEWIDNVQLKLS